MAVWTVKGGRHGEREQGFLEHSIVGGGWPELGSLEGINSVDELRDAYEEAHPEANKRQVAAYVGQLWSLRARMEPGELVVVPLKTTGTIAVGRITGDYQFREDLGENLRHLRPVEWIATDVPRDAFDQDLLYSFGAFLTIGRVKRELAEERILATVRGEEVAPTPDKHREVAAEAEIEEEEAIDIESMAREQVRQFISRTLSGHELATLVGEVLTAEGFEVTVSPPGPDQGIDVLAGSGPMGLDSPRVVVQVKKGQAGIDEFRSLRGLVTSLGADQGLLVAWRGFKGTVRSEARSEYFKIRLWDAEDLLTALFRVYEQLPDDVRSQIPLQRVWALVPSPE